LPGSVVIARGLTDRADGVGFKESPEKSLMADQPEGGDWTPGRTAEEWAKLRREDATKAIRRWEELLARKADPKECRAAEVAVFWAIWSYPKRPFDLDGKRYKTVSNSSGVSVSVTQTPPKRPRTKGPE
jgi:hypothetical protein